MNTTTDFGKIQLTPAEFRMAAYVGVARQIEAVLEGRPDRHGYKGSGWRIHVEGAAGELAVAKLMGWYWDGSVNKFRSGPDVGVVEVRNRSRHDFDLIHRPDDDPGKTYVLVTGRAPYLWVRGWRTGSDCRVDSYWKSFGGRPPAWFVPIADLSPMKGLS